MGGVEAGDGVVFRAFGAVAEIPLVTAGDGRAAIESGASYERGGDGADVERLTRANGALPAEELNHRVNSHEAAVFERVKEAFAGLGHERALSFGCHVLMLSEYP